jgi:arylsulfatase A-like enzyme
MPKRPNIIYIITDQQRWDHLGCNGQATLRTPHIDRLAREGVCFERFYTNNPICTPSRAAIITGRTPRSNRVWDNGCPLPESETTLPEALAGAGYHTWAVGKLHLTPWWAPEGRYLESRYYWDEIKSDDAPEPYLGFAGAEICTGHIDLHHGHYGRWLRREHPEVLDRAREMIEPHPSGARDTWRWTMPPACHANAWIADRACAYLAERAEAYRATGQPFFLHLGFPDPHHPFRAPEPYGSMYDPDEMTLRAPDPEPLGQKPPEYLDFFHGRLNADVLGGKGDFNSKDLGGVTEEHLRQILATTFGMVTFIDDQVGRVLAALDELGLAEDTVVVFTSDHGELMGDHHLLTKGPFLLEGLVRVPMVIRAPGRIRAGARTAALAEHIDTFPTLLEMAGVAPPRGVEGRSFLPVLTGEAERHRDRVLVEFLHQYQLDRNVKAVVEEEWKLIAWGGQSYGELYNLAADPLEAENLWDRPEAAAEQARLTNAMLHELLTTENILPYPPAGA